MPPKNKKKKVRKIKQTARAEIHKKQDNLPNKISSINKTVLSDTGILNAIEYSEPEEAFQMLQESAKEGINAIAESNKQSICNTRSENVPTASIDLPKSGFDWNSYSIETGIQEQSLCLTVSAVPVVLPSASNTIIEYSEPEEAFQMLQERAEEGINVNINAIAESNKQSISNTRSENAPTASIDLPKSGFDWNSYSIETGIQEQPLCLTVSAVPVVLPSASNTTADLGDQHSVVYTELQNVESGSPSTLNPQLASSFPDQDIIFEEIDQRHVELPLDTSTPLASPSASTILRNLQNIDSENNSFRINTPTSSLCADSLINDKNSEPAPDSDATDLENDEHQRRTPNSFLCADSPINDQTYEPSTDSNATDVENVENSPPKKKRKVKKRTDPGRIRKVNRTEWIDSKRKYQKNKGLSYTSRDGKNRSPKKIRPACDAHCRLKCKEKVNHAIRMHMFEKFWSLGDRVRQWDFLVRWCKKSAKKRITTEGESKRKYSIQYYLPKTLETADKEHTVAVCKKMFLNTFSIGEGVVRTALKKYDNDGLVIEKDGRGHHLNHPKIIDEIMIKSVCDHVNAFAPVEAHLTRKDSSKLYLDGDLTFPKMFKLYKEWVAEAPNHCTNPARTLRQYTDIVNANLKIEFHRPKKDQCDECIAYKNMPKPVPQDVQEQYDNHIKNKELVRTLKNEDKLSAINSPDTISTAAFDFEKVLSAPHAATSILYYKRKLNVLNFTIFEMGTKVGRCYMWHEGTAKRGANEVASFVFDFFKAQSEKGIKTIYLYSDNCGGQNRNRIVFYMYLIAAKKFKIDITHRFLEKGHTQNENDSIHALIERRAKNKEIYSPDQWYALVRWAKETGDPYIVKEVAREDVFNFKILLSGKNWSKNERNQKMLWSKVREIRVLCTENDVIYYKNNFDEEYQRIFVRRTKKRKLPDSPPDERLELAYNGSLTIPEDKLVDLKYLCDHNIIPRLYHDFYGSLRSGNIPVDNSSSDDE